MTSSLSCPKALAPGGWVTWPPTAGRWSRRSGFVVDNGQLVFNTGKDTAKGRALVRDPRVVMVVDTPHPPYSFVQVQGVASVSEDPGELLDIATRTGGRYMGADRAEEFGRRNGVPGELVVRITPTKVVKAFDLTN